MVQVFKGSLTSNNVEETPSFFMPSSASVTILTPTDFSKTITKEKLQEIRARNPRLYKALAESDFS